MGDWFPGGGGWFGDLKPTIGPVSFLNYFKRLSLKSVPFGTVTQLAGFGRLYGRVAIK
jgi:hypothetical protein